MFPINMGDTVVKWVVLLPHNSRVNGSLLNLGYSLTRVLHVLLINMWASSRFSGVL